MAAPETEPGRWLAGANLAGYLPDDLIETDYLGAVQYLVELVDGFWTDDSHDNEVAATERWLELHTTLHTLLTDPKPFQHTVQRGNATWVFFIDPVQPE